MEIKIKRNPFFKAVSRIQSIVEKRSNMPILSMVLLSVKNDELIVSATDLEISFQQNLKVEVIASGNVTISGRKLFEILKESKSEIISIKEKENNWVHITDGQAQYNLACLPAEEFPVLVEPENVVMADFDSDTMNEMINKTIYSVTMEEAGFKLSGVFLEKVAQEGKTYLRMVSTDGHRLSKIDKEIEDIEKVQLNGGVMIPKKGMSELNKMASEGDIIHFGFEKNNCVAKKEDALLIIRLLESKFPDYQSVIPSKTNYAIPIKKEILMDGMKKMVILSNESYRGVKITLDNNNMELVSINPDLGDVRENIEIEYNGERMEIGFNARYFIDALQSMDSDIINLGFIDNSSPCLLTGLKDEGFLGLIMPMRL